MTSAHAPFESLDFVYTPSEDVARDMASFEHILGARIVFAIEDGATRVAALELSADGPLLLLTDHLTGGRPILVYRVADLLETIAALEDHGWERARSRSLRVRACRSRCLPESGSRCIS
ncbi:MAG: VOC family protein [Actinomycetota bacterium]